MLVVSPKKILECGGKDKGAFHHLKLMENSPRWQQILGYMLEWIIEPQLPMIPKAIFLFVYFNVAKNIWFTVVKS